jgi:hypothetical protein
MRAACALFFGFTVCDATGVTGLIRFKQIDGRWVLGLALRLLTLSVLPVVLGILLDRRLGTSPFITLSMMLLSLNLGIYMVYRSVARIYKQFGGTES